MALRGALTQNIDKKDSSESWNHSCDYFDWEKEDRESFRDSSYEETGTACPKCGKILPENSRFCNYCGASLAAAEPEVNSGRRVPPARDTASPSAFASDSSTAVRDRADMNAMETSHSRADMNDPTTHSRAGVNDLGALRSRYGCAYGILIGDILCIVFGACVISLGIIISQDEYVRFAAFFGYDPYSWIIPFGLIITAIGMIDLFIRKDHRLEIYEDGIRGKGSSEWLGYRMKPFQFRFDELINIENRMFIFPGIHITAGSGQISEFNVAIRHAKKAMDEINASINP